MKRLALIAAVVVGGLTAVPGTAAAAPGDWGPWWVGSAPDCLVSIGEASYITTAYAGRGPLSYHGGVLRSNPIRYGNPYNGGICWGSNKHDDVQLGVRWRDGTLGGSWVEVIYDGITRPWPQQYELTMWSGR